MKYLFTLLHLILLTLAAALVVETVYQRIGMEAAPPSQEAAGAPPALETGKKKGAANSFKQQYTVIGSRNLFQVLTDDTAAKGPSVKNPAKTPEAVKPTSLQLTLRGTVTGLPQVHAVIEDKKTKKQEFYTVGDTVQGALLKAVSKDHVILEYNGEEQRLDMTVETALPAGRALARPAVQPRAPEPEPQEAAPTEEETPGDDALEEEAPEAPVEAAPAKKASKAEAPELTGQAGPGKDKDKDE
jgi:type II secretory pathway component PulC